MISEIEYFGFLCAKYVISEATGSFVSVCDHRNPGEYYLLRNNSYNLPSYSRRVLGFCTHLRPYLN